jgi:phosphate transport system substrate-binding protein
VNSPIALHKETCNVRFSGAIGFFRLVAAVTVAGGSMAARSEGALPSYEPTIQVQGTIRNFGFGLGGVLALWEEGFRRYHPHVRFDDHLPTSDAAIPALVTGVADLAPDGGEATLTEDLSFFEVYGYPPTSITVASGAYDVEGKSNGPVVFVHKDNPIASLSIAQLDAIFGSSRTGGMRGFQWTPSDSRGPKADIRTWGQLGLSGGWADKPIQTYGHAPSGTTRGAAQRRQVESELPRVRGDRQQDDR